jgi:hypothetical protein
MGRPTGAMAGARRRAAERVARARDRDHREKSDKAVTRAPEGLALRLALV